MAEQSDLPAKVFNIRVFPTYLYWWNFHHYSVNCSICHLHRLARVHNACAVAHTLVLQPHLFMCSLRLAPQWLSFSSNILFSYTVHVKKLTTAVPFVPSSRVLPRPSSSSWYIARTAPSLFPRFLNFFGQVKVLDIVFFPEVEGSMQQWHHH